MLSFLLAFLATGLPILVLVTTVEYFWRKEKYNNELTRKFIHIIVGTYTAFWPWFLSWRNIELLAVGAFCALVVSRLFNVFGSMHQVRRYATGELLSTAGVGLTAFLTHNNWFFAAAILTVSLADGLAAVMGTLFGKRTRYKILGQTKSLAGSATFFVVSLVILIAYQFYGSGIGFGPVVVLALVATLAENIGLWGLDNIILPLLIVIALSSL